MSRYTVAFLPAVQRDLFLSRAVRRKQDPVSSYSTLGVVWDDMNIVFATSNQVSPAIIDVDPDISLNKFTPRLESLLDCYDPVTKPQEPWKLKYSGTISKYCAQPELAVELLCDRIQSREGSEDIIGVMKIKRRGVRVGYAKVRIVPAQDLFQLSCEHQSAQGLKAVWKSALWRLSPSYSSKPSKASPSAKGVRIIMPPCLHVVAGSDYYQTGASYASKFGYPVDLKRVYSKKTIDVQCPVDGYKLAPLGKWSGGDWFAESTYPHKGIYKTKVAFKKMPIGGIPDWLTIESTSGFVVIQHGSYALFHRRCRALEAMAGGSIFPNLPDPPGHPLDKPPLTVK